VLGNQQAWRPFFAMADIEENAGRKAAGKKEIVLSRIERITRFGALVWMQWGIVLDKVSGLVKFYLIKGLKLTIVRYRPPTPPGETVPPLKR
jgi:hypothetical protein